MKDWRTEAACVGMPSDLFFPRDGVGRGLEAKLICAGCPVTEECMEFAFAARVDLGIWGGLNRNELVRERRRRARTVAEM